MTAENTRAVEQGIVQDFRTNLSYGAYLHLDELLAAQQPVSSPEHHDELLFIIQHQTSELWLKLMLHELRSAPATTSPPTTLAPALKKLARVKHIQKHADRAVVGAGHADPQRVRRVPRRRWARRRASSPRSTAPSSSLLGQQERGDAQLFDARPAAHADADGAAGAPQHLRRVPPLPARRGHAVPSAVLERDVPSRPPVLPRARARVHPHLRRHRRTTGTSTRRARSSSTSRRTSSCGASATSRRSSARSAGRPAPAAPAACGSCARPLS